jgi:hypothetical protein
VVEKKLRFAVKKATRFNNTLLEKKSVFTLRGIIGHARLRARTRAISME